jgi:hypothetical protein
MILCGKLTSDSGRAIDSRDCLSALTPRNASTIAAITITAPAKQYARNNAGRDPEPMPSAPRQSAETLSHVCFYMFDPLHGFGNLG